MGECIAAILLMIGAGHALNTQRSINNVLKVYLLMLTPTLAAFLFITIGTPLWMTYTAIGIGAIPGMIAAGGLIALFIRACIRNRGDGTPDNTKTFCSLLMKIELIKLLRF